MKDALEGLIKFRENDLVMDMQEGRVTDREVEHFTELVIAVTRLVNDIRYCRNKMCGCSPESSISYHFKKLEKYFSLRGPLNLTYIPLKEVKEIADKYYRNEWNE